MSVRKHAILYCQLKRKSHSPACLVQYLSISTASCYMHSLQIASILPQSAVLQQHLLSTLHPIQTLIYIIHNFEITNGLNCFILQSSVIFYGVVYTVYRTNPVNCEAIFFSNCSLMFVISVLPFSRDEHNSRTQRRVRQGEDPKV